MKKIIYIVLAVLVIIGIAITATIGLNVDIIYKAHEEVEVYIGKETDKKEIEAIAKETFENQKIVVNNIEVFNDAFLIKVENVSDEQIESLKQKVAEKYELQDTDNIVKRNYVSNFRLRDIIKPYFSPSNNMPIIVSTIIILVFMAIRFKKLGSIKVLLQTVVMIVMSEVLLLSIVAIIRYPVNRYIIPTGLIVYIGTIIITNMQFIKNLEEYNSKQENKEEI